MVAILRELNIGKKLAHKQQVSYVETEIAYVKRLSGLERTDEESGARIGAWQRCSGHRTLKATWA